MTDYPLVWAVKRKDETYLADPFHHTRWTTDLRAAKVYLNYIDAKITAEREGAKLVPVSLVAGEIVK